MKALLLQSINLSAEDSEASESIEMMEISGQESFSGAERFLIRRELGAGAFGVVYEVYDKSRDAIVALKVLKQKDPDALYRFKKEFRTLTGLIHPNLVTFYKLMSNGRDWFFTMELVNGVDFLDYVRGARISRRIDAPFSDPNTSTIALLDTDPLTGGGQEETLQYQSEEEIKAAAVRSSSASADFDIFRLRGAMAQLVQGVCAIHEAGKLHRDIKPSNVLVTQEGRVVLLDFGLVTELAPNLKESIAIAGTPAYMSPEQAAGLPTAEASDWYSVGVMLYEALTGTLPFTGNAYDVLRNKQRYEPTPPNEVVSGIPDELNHLCAALLRIDPETRPSGREIIERLGQTQPAETSPSPAQPKTTKIPFVGRKRQLARLDEAFRAVAEEQAVIAFVHGVSGMGKSTLIRHYLENLQREDPNIVVLGGRCYEQESVPYKALDSLVDSLSRYLRQLPLLDAESLMPRDVLALARLFPVLRQVEAVARGKRRAFDVLDIYELRRRAFSAMRDLLSRLSDQKRLVLFIDDLQWGDIDSGALLSEILRPPDPPALLLIVAYRSDEVENNSILRELLSSIRAANSSNIREISIGELDPSEAVDLALTLIGQGHSMSKAQARTIAQESGGSPLFIDELTRYAKSDAKVSDRGMERVGGVEKVDISLNEMIYARYTQLPESSRRLLEVLAIAGRPVERGVAKRAAQLTNEEQQTLIALRSGHLVRTRDLQDRQEIEIYHDRIREIITTRLSPESLRAHHHNLALALEVSKNTDPETLAIHYQGAGDNERAADYAVEAAEHASMAFAFDRAARLYRLALDLHPKEIEDRELRVRLANALSNAGRGAEAASGYMEAAVGANAAEATELKRRAAEQLLRSGHIDEGMSVLRTVLNSMGLKLADTPKKALVSLLAQRILLRLRGLKFRERDESQISAEEITRIDTCWSVAVGLSMVDVIRGAEFQARHLLFALRAGEPSRVARALTTEAAYTATSGTRSVDRTERLLQRAKTLAERIQRPDAFGRVLLAEGISAYLRGEWKRSVESTEQAEKILREQCTGVAWERHTAQHFYLMSLVSVGEWKEISNRLPNLLKEAKERGDLLAEANLGIRMSYITILAADEVERAQEVLRQGMAGWSRRGFHTQHYYDLIRRGEIALYTGEEAAAYGLMAERWSALSQSLILNIQVFRVESLFLRARAALAAYGSAVKSEPAQTAARFLQEANRDAKKIEREDTRHASAMALLIRAGIAAARNEQSGSLSLLSDAEKGFMASDMLLYAAAVRRRRGELLGGDEGRALIDSADSCMTNQGIQKPVGVVNMLAPGKWS